MRLSICIPTRNFGPYISQTIESILVQGEEGIQIVILDSGSTDITSKIVSSFQEKYPNIDYYYEDKAEGVDKGIAKVVSFAKAPYCWLLSSDDALLPGSIKKILEIVETKCDVILCNRFWCDINLNIIHAEDWRENIVDDTEIFSFSDKTALKKYLESSTSLGALFSFMSCIVIRKSSWDTADFGLDYIGTNYAHVPRLFEMSKKQGGIAYIKKPLILCRSGNDSFRKDGLLGRMLIDLRAYYRFGQDFFPEDRDMQSLFYRVLIRAHGYKRWIKAFLLCSSKSQADGALILLEKLGYNKLFCDFIFLLNHFIIRWKAKK